MTDYFTYALDPKLVAEEHGSGAQSLVLRVHWHTQRDETIGDVCEFQRDGVFLRDRHVTASPRLQELLVGRPEPVVVVVCVCVCVCVCVVATQRKRKRERKQGKVRQCGSQTYTHGKGGILRKVRATSIHGHEKLIHM